MATQRTGDGMSTYEHQPRGLNTKAAAAYLSLSTSWLRKARMGVTTIPGPEFKKVGTRVIYPLDALDNFLDDRP